MRTDVNKIEVGQKYQHPQRGKVTIKDIQKDAYTSIVVQYEDEQYEDEVWFAPHFLMKFRGPDDLDEFMSKLKNHKRTQVRDRIKS